MTNVADLIKMLQAEPQDAPVTGLVRIKRPSGFLKITIYKGRR